MINHSVDIMGGDNHGQIRRLLNTLLEPGSDILQMPSTREEALNCAVGPSLLGGTDPGGGHQPGYNLPSGQADHTVVPVYLSTSPPHTIVRGGRRQNCR